MRHEKRPTGAGGLDWSIRNIQLSGWKLPNRPPANEVQAPLFPHFSRAAAP
jgi:hypothetical protein